MEMKPGYRQTDAGVIPEDWEVDPLGALTDPKRPISYGIVQTGPSVPNGVRCLRVLDVDGGRINKSALITTTKTISGAYKRTVLRSGDLVMPLRGKVGDVASIDDDLTGCNLTRGLALIAIRSDWSASFCKQFISSIATRSRLEQSMNGSALQEIPIATLRTFKIALPPTKAEQEAIAEALSDADTLIESLEQLLAKKRRLKQGAMQELLTGKKRLPGFEIKPGYKQTEVGMIPKDWKTARFSEFMEFQNGVNADKSSYGTGIRFINVLEVITRSHLHAQDIPGRVELSKSRATAYTVRRGDIVFNRTSETQEEVGLSAVYVCDESVVFGGFVIRGRPKDERLHSIYAGYGLRAPLIRKQITARGQGAIRANIGQADLTKVLVPLPDKAEQAAIAAILSDMDTEIAALEAKLAKAHQLKQGMMQELLTGRIRLV